MTNTNDTINLYTEGDVLAVVAEIMNVSTTGEGLTKAQIQAVNDVTGHTCEILAFMTNEDGLVTATTAKMVARRVLRTYNSGIESARRAMAYAINDIRLF